MQTYSAFFQTLHDELTPTGTLGRGTHYSILRAVVFHDIAGKSSPEGLFHDFAIIWDEDHDKRVLEPIEKLYFAGLLSQFLMFGERKGSFVAVLSRDMTQDIKFLSLADQVTEITRSVAGDSWPTQLLEIEASAGQIISDQPEKVHLYLRTLQMVWELGSKRPSRHVTPPVPQSKPSLPVLS
jgi:hypothetical protein